MRVTRTLKRNVKIILTSEEADSLRAILNVSHQGEAAPDSAEPVSQELWDKLFNLDY